MTRRRWAALILVVLFGVVACDTGTSERTVTPTARVQATADGLMLDGSPWWPAGLNAYQLATDWSVNRGCGAEVDTDSFFASLPEASEDRYPR